MFDEFKDLKKGDAVRFENVMVHAKLSISGEGVVYGFGTFGHTDLVWAETPDGDLRAIPYEKIIKV